MTLRAVLFDAGDTLIRLRGDSGALLATAAERLGVALPSTVAAEVWARVIARASTPEELAKGRDLTPARHRAVWTDLYASCGADELNPGLADALYDVTVDPSSWEAFPDTVATLRTLHGRGIRVGVLSDTGFDLRPVFDKLGLSQWLDAVVLSCESGACKPEPAVFRAACDQLGVPPAATLMVGDNPLTDGGAVAAGLPVLLLPSGGDDHGLGHVLSLVGGE